MSKKLLISFKESAMEDADSLLWGKCLFFLECYIVLIVEQNYIKLEQKTGHTKKNILYV